MRIVLFLLIVLVLSGCMSGPQLPTPIPVELESAPRPKTPNPGP